jgi:L-fuculokinase
MNEVVLVIDCGSTNLTVAAVDTGGRIVASAARPNGPVPQEGGEGWLVWDLDAIYRAACACIQTVMAEAGKPSVAAVTVTTWGADGAPITADGELTYPPIAWQCPRTDEIAPRITAELGSQRLFAITGYQPMPFNTLYKLAWLRENTPEALDRATAWLMMAGLLSYRLCGKPSVDITGASTTMAFDLMKGTWSDELLRAVGLDASFFPPLVYPGEVIGALTPAAAVQAGLGAGVPVVAAGHDTQFAPIGSGAGKDEALLSTGTWEIAMLRTPTPVTSAFAFEGGILTEADAVKGLYDPQLLMMGSGVLEWVREKLFSTVSDRDVAYETMIAEASALAPGADGVMMVPAFMPTAGPARRYGTAGTVVGLGLSSTRAHLYRAALEGLCFQLRQALEILTEATGFRPQRVRVVGGGAKNDLWNRLRADVCRLPLMVSETKEATVLGGAVAAWVGAGWFSSLTEGEQSISADARMLEPSDQAGRYEGLFERYRKIAPSLRDFYTA